MCIAWSLLRTCFVRTEIEWNAGKNITQKVMKKKPKKGSKNTKPVTKTEQCESFFNFFSPPQVPEDDDIDQETVTLPPSYSLFYFPTCIAYAVAFLILNEICPRLSIY